MTGRVTLVGGGPGAIDLLTVRAVRALASADVILHDRLAPTEQLSQWAPQAQFFDVGKRPGHHRVTQESIHQMMLSAAREGNHVVRLKGGDPFVLGRGCEEVAACREAGIPVTVVPGITSAISVPAAAGVPVTARGVSKAFTVISGHDPLSEDELRGLVSLGGTVVILMGIGTMGHTIESLQRLGLPTQTPVCLVEKGYSPQQRILIAPAQRILEVAAQAKVRSPAVMVIGDVVHLAADADDVGRSVLDTSTMPALQRAEEIQLIRSMVGALA